MTETKLTPWFWRNAPARLGVYELKCADPYSAPGRYSYWNGSYWCSTAGSAAEAMARRLQGPTILSVRAWRGTLK